MDFKTADTTVKCYWKKFKNEEEKLNYQKKKMKIVNKCTICKGFVDRKLKKALQAS